MVMVKPEHWLTSGGLVLPETNQSTQASKSLFEIFSSIITNLMAKLKKIFGSSVGARLTIAEPPQNNSISRPASPRISGQASDVNHSGGSYSYRSRPDSSVVSPTSPNDPFFQTEEYLKMQASFSK
ncbi:MAG: hypothetical protein ACOYK9_05770 [Chlamydiia bacterium]